MAKNTSKSDYRGLSTDKQHERQSASFGAGRVELNDVRNLEKYISKGGPRVSKDSRDGKGDLSAAERGSGFGGK